MSHTLWRTSQLQTGFGQSSHPSRQLLSQGQSKRFLNKQPNYLGVNPHQKLKKPSIQSVACRMQSLIQLTSLLQTKIHSNWAISHCSRHNSFKSGTLKIQSHLNFQNDLNEWNLRAFGKNIKILVDCVLPPIDYLRNTHAGPCKYGY